MKKTVVFSLVFSFLSFFAFSSFAQTVSIKKSASYSKGLYNNEPRVILLLSDNSFWWSGLKKSWEKVPMTGLPQADINDFIVIQKAGMMGQLETRIIAVLNNKSIYWYAEGKAWEAINTEGLPNVNIKNISVYYKNAGSILQSAKIIAVLDNNTVYGYNGNNWESIDLAGLPLTN